MGSLAFALFALFAGKHVADAMTTTGARFCPNCGTALVNGSACPRCTWRPAVSDAVGTVLWRAELGLRHGRALLVPAATAGVWCLPTEAGELLAVDVATGALLWRRGVDEHGAATAIAAMGELLLVGPADTRPVPGGARALLALDARSGAEVWRFATGAHSLSAPAVADDGTLVISASDGRLYALDGAGGLRWSAPHPAWGPAAPVVAGDVVVAGGRGAVLAAYEARGGERLWQLEGRAWFAGPLAAAGGRLFTLGFDGTLYAVGLHDGARLWQLRGERGKGFSAPPAADAERVYIGDRVAVAAGGRGYAVRSLAAADGAEQGRFAVDDGVLLTALLDAPAALICCTERGGLYALDPGSLAEAWRHSGAAPAVALPCVVGGRLIVADGAGSVAALRLGADEAHTGATTPGTERGRLAQALLARREAGDWRRVADLAALLGLPDEEAQAREHLGELPEAAAAYEQAAERAVAAGESGRGTAALLYVNAAALYDQLDQAERAAACRDQIGRLRRTPDLVTRVRARAALTELEWNELELEVENVGHGPARDVTLQLGGPFDSSGPLVLASVAPGRVVRSVARLRPRAGEYGPAVPLELRASYRDLAGQQHSEREERSVSVRQRGSQEHAPPLEMTVGSTQARAAEPRRPLESLELPLTVRFAPGDNGTRVHWESEIVGSVDSVFKPPFAGPDLALVVRALDELQRPQGAFAADELERLAGLGLPIEHGLLQQTAHCAVGRAIYKAITAHPDALRALATIRNVAIANSRTAVVRLHFAPDEAALAALPWELIWDEGAEPLLLSRGQLIACTRHLDLDQALPPPRPRSGPLRLTAVTPAAGLDPADVAEERTRREAALAPLQASGALLLDSVAGPVTPRALNDHFDRTGPPDIIHFVGHGRYDAGRGFLVLDKEGGGMEPVPAERIVQLFRGARLVVLHACQSSMVGQAGLLTGVGPALGAAGVQAVVAMQLTVRLAAATRFAERLYTALARGESLQTAVSLGRQALYTEEADGASWYVPTLTIRSSKPEPLFLVGE